MKKIIALLFFFYTNSTFSSNPISDFYQKNNITSKSLLIAMAPNDCENCITPVDELLKKIRNLNSDIPIYIISNYELSEMEKILFENKLGIALMNIQFVSHKNAYNYLLSKEDGVPSICYVSETSKILCHKNLKDDNMENIFKFITKTKYPQTTYSEYKGINSNFSKINYTSNTDEEIIPLLDLFSNSGIIAKYKMYIHSDCNFAFIKIILEEVNVPGIAIGEESEENYLLDYKKKIFYDLKKLTFSKYKDPDNVASIEKNKTDSVYNVLVINTSNSNDTALITFKRSLPKCLTNRIILLDNEYGIQKIQTKKQYIKLTLFNPDSGFDLSKKIEFAKTKCTNEVKSINYLFLK